MKKAKELKRIDRIFQRLAKDKFNNPVSCTDLRETRGFIFELNTIIKQFEREFNYVPISARLLFYRYNLKQEMLLFNNYKKENSNTKIPRVIIQNASMVYIVLTAVALSLNLFSLNYLF
jgi:hypothetical protein